jgi:hypothetical protein
LLGAVFLDLYARWGRREDLRGTTTGLMVAGLVTGVLTAAAGIVAFRTIPDTHTEEAHSLMNWHLLVQLAALDLFAVSMLLRKPGWPMAITGSLAPAMGLATFFLVSAEGSLLYWHLAVQIVLIALFLFAAFALRATIPTDRLLRRSLVVSLVGLLALIGGSGLGGYIVYHGAAGIAPELLKPNLHEDHPSGTHHFAGEHEHLH